MKYFIGLGNPGKDYEKTRHNVGFMVIDELSKRWNLPLNKEKFKGLYGSGIINGEKVILLKPLTYMNLSGESIKPLMDYYDIELEDVIVIYDDLDLPTGSIRLRTKGSAGGHNGIKSTIQHLGTQTFKRIRIGIDRPTNGMRVPDYVLGVFGAEERPTIENAIVKSADACEKWLTSPFVEVMNEFNKQSDS
ncbi:aminoacyl-tRNA hydrolase [Bacillus sp. Marseille-P3661]|uniref:aminoacyl-tRNA hydrolase n=1 Tax=Bacillus sp. Marseille-P3661 TaxID=1936234 RepID=UPI000C846CFD|nr:aminoacyl-tRNA hydrolase [Bacillus sp. Marseille-P3661]